jgi:prepilin-type N-terminal cleavage/methylation domain-containing protein/prepilin-type processing-associated H-X9-DG protein
MIERRGFTLLEMLVSVSLIAVLAAFLAPMGGRALDRARGVKCANALRQLGLATLLYARDNEMTLPATSHQRSAGGKSWTVTLQEYAGGTVSFRCPCDENSTRPYSYILNDFLTPHPAGAPDLDFSRLTCLRQPGATVLFGEAAPSYTGSDHFHFSEYVGQPIPPDFFSSQVAVTRHGDSANYVFADGHGETLTWAQVQQILQARVTPFIDPTSN